MEIILFWPLQWQYWELQWPAFSDYLFVVNFLRLHSQLPSTTLFSTYYLANDFWDFSYIILPSFSDFYLLTAIVLHCYGKFLGLSCHLTCRNFLIITPCAEQSPLCYVIWLFVKRLSQEAIQRRSQRDRLVKIKVFKLRRDADDIPCNITLRSAGGESFHSAGPTTAKARFW